MTPRTALLLDSSIAPTRTMPLAAAAAAAGIGRIWISEDYYRKGAFSTAGAILGSNDSIEVGLGVASLLARHPAALAMEISTLTEMFPGRFLPGVGLGSTRALRQMHLLPEKVVGSVSRNLAVLRKLLDGETSEWIDDQFRGDDISLDYPGGPQVPLWVAASGPQMLKLAARNADGLILSVMSSPSYARWVHEQVDDILATRKQALPITAFVYVSCDADHERAELAARRFVASQLRTRAASSVMLTASSVADQLDELRAGDPETLPERLPEDVVQEYVAFGPAEAIRARLAEFSGHVDEVALCPIASIDGVRPYPELIAEDLW